MTINKKSLAGIKLTELFTSAGSLLVNETVEALTKQKEAGTIIVATKFRGKSYSLEGTTYEGDETLHIDLEETKILYMNAVVLKEMSK
jgi:hypothetical protein